MFRMMPGEEAPAATNRDSSARSTTSYPTTTADNNDNDTKITTANSWAHYQVNQ